MEKRKYDRRNIEDKEKIKKILIKYLHDKEGDIRNGAIRGIGYLGDTNLIPYIKKVVDEDPYSINIEREKKYILRKEAKKVLKKLEEKKENKSDK